MQSLKATDLGKPNTLGLDSFLNTISIVKSALCEKIISELRDFIIASGCKEIKFSAMSNRAMGISKTNVCILNPMVLAIPDEYALYIILHEISHQYQYKKHGKNVALPAYLSSTSIDDAVNLLLELEQTADRLAIAKLNKILKSGGIQLEKPIVSRYLEVKDTSKMKTYLEKIRLEASQRGLSSIEEINDYIHSSIL